MVKSSKKIRIFSTPSCPYCITLKHFLEQHSFEFEDIDVSKDEKYLEEMIQKSGQMGVPVVEIDKEIIVGFDKPKIVKLLNIIE